MHTYQRVSTDQQKAAYKVLMANASFENGEQSVQIWDEVTHHSGTADNITINVNPTFMVGSSQVEKEFDDIRS